MNTKIKTPLASLLVLLSSFLLAACGGGDNAQGDHDHSSAEHEHQEGAAVFAREPGPNGGRLITEIDPSAEFFLRADNFAQITFVGPAGMPVPVAEQSATAVTGDRMNPTTVEFEKQGDVLVSSTPLPKIEGQPTVLTLKASPDAEPVVERFNLKTYTCSGCGLQEYACICGH